MRAVQRRRDEIHVADFGGCVDVGRMQNRSARRSGGERSITREDSRARAIFLSLDLLLKAPATEQGRAEASWRRSISRRSLRWRCYCLPAGDNGSIFPARVAGPYAVHTVEDKTKFASLVPADGAALDLAYGDEGSWPRIRRGRRQQTSMRRLS